MNSISNNYSSFNNYPNPYYYAGNSPYPNTVRYYEQQTPREADSTEQTAKTLGLAGLLQVLSSSIQKGSKYLSNKLAAGKEFTTAENVKKAANHMIGKNKLNLHVGYIDDANKLLYAQNYGMPTAFEEVAKGQNAFFSDKLKLAVAPKTKPSLILHELGHAVNAKGAFTKILQKSRRYAGYAPMALLVANGLFSDKNDGKKSFVEKNAGVLGFCAFLPTIIEEGMASFRGIKAAKKVLNNPSTLKILKKNYALALGTYVLAGIGLGIASKQTILWNGGSEQTGRV